MDPNEPRRRMTSDQKRALLTVLVIVGVIAIVAIGIGWLAFSLGLPFWIAVILTITITAIVGLFMFLNMV